MAAVRAVRSGADDMPVDVNMGQAGWVGRSSGVGGLGGWVCGVGGWVGGRVRGWGMFTACKAARSA
jgi:hypothetical protein